MQLFKESTKFKPLLFFETFLNKETLMKYEDNFYNHTNNSQVNYREQGFIEYYKDSYKLNEPVTLVRVYFKDYFEMFLTTQVTKTLSLIEIRTDDLDYDITKINFFITNIQQKMHFIKKCISGYF